MGGIYVEISAALWLVWVITWYAAAFWRHEPVTEAPHDQYRLPVAIILLGFLLAFGVVPSSHGPLWLVGPTLGWSMVALAAAGLAFAWWARIHMGPLWHGGVSRTEQHRVIDSGPFALVRHPIYSGMIAALWAVAALQPRPLALAGAVLFAIGFMLKARVEERFLASELPDYVSYRDRVRMIVPFVI